jgi:hypothetical protein
VRVGHSSGTGDFEATAATKATGDGFDAEGKPGGHDGLTGAATDSLWRCPRVAEATEGCIAPVPLHHLRPW